MKLLNRLARRGGNGPSKKKRRGNGLSAWLSSKWLSGGLSTGNGAPVAAHSKMLRTSMRFHGGNGNGGSTGMLTISGRDLIQTFTVLTSNAGGDRLCDVWINPVKLGASRLAVLAGMYERYSVAKMKFIYEGSVPTTQNGTIIGFVDYDVLETPPVTGGGLALIQRASAHIGSHPAKLWETSEWDYKPDAQMTDLYCDVAAYEPRLTTPAHFVMLVNDMPTITADLALGKLYVEYTINFQYPKIQTTTPAALWGVGLSNSSGTGATAAKPIGTSATAFSWNSVPLSDFKDDVDTGGTACQSLVVPTPGDYLVTVNISLATGDTVAYPYISLPGASTPYISNSFCSTTGATAPHAAYVTYNLYSHGGVTLGTDAIITTLTHVHVVDAGAKIYFQSRPSSTAKPCRIHVVRLPYVALGGTDMYVAFTKLVGQLRSFSREYEPALASAGLDVRPLLETTKQVDEPSSPFEEPHGAAAGPDGPVVTPRPSLVKLKR